MRESTSQAFEKRSSSPLRLFSESGFNDVGVSFGATPRSLGRSFTTSSRYRQPNCFKHGATTGMKANCQNGVGSGVLVRSTRKERSWFRRCTLRLAADQDRILARGQALAGTAERRRQHRRRRNATRSTMVSNYDRILAEITKEAQQLAPEHGVDAEALVTVGHGDSRPRRSAPHQEHQHQAAGSKTRSSPRQ